MINHRDTEAQRKKYIFRICGTDILQQFNLGEHPFLNPHHLSASSCLERSRRIVIQ